MQWSLVFLVIFNFPGVFQVWTNINTCLFLWKLMVDSLVKKWIVYARFGVIHRLEKLDFFDHLKDKFDWWWINLAKMLASSSSSKSLLKKMSFWACPKDSNLMQVIGRSFKELKGKQKICRNFLWSFKTWNLWRFVVKNQLQLLILLELLLLVNKIIASFIRGHSLDVGLFLFFLVFFFQFLFLIF